jgi:diguanylate cyclase (GGDEF)-like protein
MNPDFAADALTVPTDLTPALLAALDAQGTIWWVKDAEGRYLHLNRAGHELFGIAPGEARGLTDADLLPHVQAASLRAADQGVLAQERALTGEHQIDAGGTRRELSAVRIALPPGADGSRRLLGLWFDATPLRQRSAELRAALNQLEQQQQANEALRAEVEGRGARETEAAARLVQREQFDEFLRREVDLSLREHREFAVVCVVVDGPPDGSPAHGAAGRERVLEALGRLLRSNTRAMDAPCRIDDERFAVLLSGVGLATAHSRMEGLRRQCATQLVPVGGEALRFTVSMGVASFPHTAQTQAGLIGAAEVALAQARERGGNRVALASIAFGGPATA